MNADSLKNIKNFGSCSVKKLSAGNPSGKKGKIKPKGSTIKSKYSRRKTNNSCIPLTSPWLYIPIRKKTNNNCKISSKVSNNGSKSCLSPESMAQPSIPRHFFNKWPLNKSNTCQILTISITNCLNLTSSFSLRHIRKLSWCKKTFSILDP